MNYFKIAFLLLVGGNFVNVRGQQFHNLDFSQKCDSSKTGLYYWDLSWGAKGSVKQDNIDGSNCLLLTGSNQNDVSFTEQTSSPGLLNEIHIITVTAAIHSEKIEGKGAGLDVQVLDKDGRLIAFKDMGGFYSVSWVQGTAGWKTHSISLVCPAEASKIKIGAILYGKGKAWLKQYKVTLTALGNRKPNRLSEKYISAVCDTIKEHSLYRDSLDIKALKEIASKIAGAAKKYSDCYLSVNYLLEALRQFGDEHSFFMSPAEVMNLQKGGSLISKIRNPEYKIIDQCGYILVPPFHGTNSQLKLEYADSLQMAIRLLDASGIKGWIIDLRENTGGDMEPMIAGLGPLFSSEKLGALVDVNNKYDSWYYNDGKYFWDDGYNMKILHHVSLRRKLPVAVLIGNKTGSSGEAVVISFIGNEKTRSFGQSTWGLTTGNGSFDLMDGANIHLASTRMADRNGKIYTGPIMPDQLAPANSKDNIDHCLQSAINWINN